MKRCAIYEWERGLHKAPPRPIPRPAWKEIRMLTLKKAGALGLMCAVLTSACAGSSESLLPTAPSAVVVSSNHQTSSESIHSGLGKGNDKVNGSVKVEL